MKQHLPDALLVVALALVVAGVALVSLSTALVVAGLGCGLGAYLTARTEAPS